MKTAPAIAPFVTGGFVTWALTTEANRFQGPVIGLSEDHAAFCHVKFEPIYPGMLSRH